MIRSTFKVRCLVAYDRMLTLQHKQQYFEAVGSKPEVYYQATYSLRIRRGVFNVLDPPASWLVA